MGFLGSMFSGGAGMQAYNPAQAQMIGPEGGNYGQQYMAQQAGIGSQQQGLVGQQQGLIDALKQQSAGNGPSVAGQQVQQSLQQQQNAAQAQTAGQRGINPALAMRTSMEQQGQNAQNAAQTGAMARAQEQLNAQGQLGNAINSQGNQLNTMGSQNLQSQGMNLHAQEANQDANLRAQGMTMNAGQAQNQAQSQMMGGLMNGIGTAMAMASGGNVPDYYDDGGSVTPSSAGPMSALGKMFSGFSSGFTAQPAAGAPQANAQSNPSTMFGKGIGNMLKNSQPTYDSVQSDLASKGFTPAAANAVAMENGLAPQGPSMPFKSGGNVGGGLKSGGGVPGKAKVSGNSVKNDNVKALLSPGEGVIDRETMHHPGGVGDAARFVMAYVNSKKKASK